MTGRKDEGGGMSDDHLRALRELSGENSRTKNTERGV